MRLLLPALATLALATLALAAPAAPAGAQTARTLVVVRASSPVAVDGRLDDVAWSAAAVASGFTQREPEAGSAASEASTVRLLYDDAALYVAFRLDDRAPDSLAATLARRDFAGFSDWAHVYIDSYHDRRTAFRFSVNPAGVKSDAAIAGDDHEDEDAGWDAVWDAAVRRDSSGWTAELRIPFTQLRFEASPGAEGQRWGIQFGRQLARRGEWSLWAPSRPEDRGFVSRFAELRGLDVRAGRRLETTPYVLARARQEPGAPADPFHRRNDLATAVGADVRYGLTSDLTLTATINPDFGQVEADPSEVNLTGLETFLAEKRPFFVEGADIFQLELSEASWIHGTEEVFYSRRVGRAVQGRAPAEALFVDHEPASRILGAAKLSGRTSDGWALGFLTAATGAEHARFVTGDDARGRVMVEPLTSYSVARVSREAREGRAAFGSVLTATNRRLSGEMRLLPAAAYVGGVDGRLRFGPNGGWDVTGSLLGSRLAGDASAIDAVRRNAVHRHQRPDADHLDYAPGATSLAGYSATGSVGKNDGRWRGSLGAHVVSPGFDANDLGYHTASDLARVHVLLGYQDLRPATFRKWWWWWNSWTSRTHGGERTALGTQLNGNVEFHSLWFLAGSLRRDQPALSPTMLRGGPALYLPARTRVALSLASDQRRAVGATMAGSLLRGAQGERIARLAPLVTVRPSPRAELSLSPSVQWTRDPSQWLGQWSHDGTAVHLTGALRQVTTAMTARANLAFTRDLSFQLYAQPFSSEGRYGTIREVTAPRAAAFDERLRAVQAAQEGGPGGAIAIDRDGDGATDFSIADPAFDVKELRTNAVLRWEMRPGSTLFLVWSHSREGRAVDPDPDDDVWTDGRDLMRLPSTNVLLVKVSTWIGW